MLKPVFVLTSPIETACRDTNVFKGQKTQPDGRDAMQEMMWR